MSSRLRSDPFLPSADQIVPRDDYDPVPVDLDGTALASEVSPARAARRGKALACLLALALAAPAAAEAAPLTLDVSKGRYEIELESATRLVSTLPGISCHA
jgi:hypothetical protein